MEDTLKRLLIVETGAEQLVAKAKAEREQIIQDALIEARQAEQDNKQKYPELHATELKKAEERVTQTIAELNKHYEERKIRLRELAEENQQQALEAAVDLLMRRGYRI